MKRLLIVVLVMLLFVGMASAQDAMYFESESIELWDTKGDYSNLLSERYSHRDRKGTRDLSTLLALDGLVFNGEDISFELSVDENAIFDIVLIALESGAYKLNTGEEFRHFEINSILLVDRAIFGDEIVYIDGGVWNELGNDNASYMAEYPVLAYNISNPNQDYLAVNGTIMVPFDPIEFTSSDTGLTFSLNWLDQTTYDVDISVLVK